MNQRTQGILLLLLAFVIWTSAQVWIFSIISRY